MSNSSDLHHLSTAHDVAAAHEPTLPGEGARSLFVLTVAAMFCVVLFLALGAIGPQAAGASEPAPVAEVADAMVCEMGDGVVTTTESGAMVEPAVCEVRHASLTGPRAETGVVRPSSHPTEIASAGILPTNVSSVGWRPWLGALLIGASVVIRLLGGAFRRRRNLRW